jgi:outer membrane lipoprotein-sorting protein
MAKAEAAVCPEMNFSKNGYVLAVKGIERIDDPDVYVLDVDRGSAKVTYYFDVNSFLILRNTATMETPQGTIQQITEYSDYRPVNGVLFPYSIIQKVPSVGMEMKMNLTDIQINTGLSADEFK